MSTNSYPDQSRPMNCGSLECTLTSYATARILNDDIVPLRKQSDTLPGNLGNSVLRHSDEQTLTALVAIKDASRTGGLFSRLATWDGLHLRNP